MADELDRACVHCGEILSGPNAGEHVPPAGARIHLPPGQMYYEHKGRKITHCSGHGCPEEEAADTQFWNEYYATHPRKKPYTRPQNLTRGSIVKEPRTIGKEPPPEKIRTIGPLVPREGRRNRKPPKAPPIDPMKETLP